MTEAMIRYEEQYPALMADTVALRDTLEANIGGDQVDATDLPQVRVPAGGGQAWEVDDESLKSIEGIIVYRRLVRAYWPVPFDERGPGDSQPACSSVDAIHGQGDPGGSCATCPLAQFGSDSRGRGQACQQRHELFVVQPGELLPIAVSIPPSSLKAAKKFLMRLTSKQLPYWCVVTRIGLEKDKNPEGIVFSRCTFELVGKLEGEEKDRMRDYVSQINGTGLASEWKKRKRLSD